MSPLLVASRSRRLQIYTTIIGKCAESDSGMEPDENVSVIVHCEDILPNDLFFMLEQLR